MVIKPTSSVFTLGAANICEFISDRLFFTWLDQPPTFHNSDGLHYFTVDDQLTYTPFFSDFGPMNISHIYRFCLILHAKLQDASLAAKKVCFYSSSDEAKRANAAFLICCYMMIVKGYTPADAYQPLAGLNPYFMPFRDAGYGNATFHITILDCLQGLHKALMLRLVKLEDFDLDEYEFYERVENGDFNWISPSFIAFASPQDETSPTSTKRPPHAFNHVLSYFRHANVQAVVRLNNRLYDKRHFEDAEIAHHEMYYPDGSCPPDAIVDQFLGLCEEVIAKKGVIAVHCKAGLGRTGTLIAAYLMRTYKFTAKEVIAFLRIMRPGCVVGPQQHWLQIHQEKLWNWVIRPSTPSKIPIRSPTPTRQFDNNSSGRKASTHKSRPSTPMDTDISSDMDVDCTVIPVQPRKATVQTRTQTAMQRSASGSPSHRYNLRSAASATAQAPSTPSKPSGTSQASKRRGARRGSCGAIPMEVVQMATDITC